MSNNNDVRKISRDMHKYQLIDNNGKYFLKKKRGVILEYLNTQITAKQKIAWDT